MTDWMGAGLRCVTCRQLSLFELMSVFSEGVVLLQKASGLSSSTLLVHRCCSPEDSCARKHEDTTFLKSLNLVEPLIYETLI